MATKSSPDRGVRNVALGAFTVGAGVWLGSLALESRRSGIPLPGNARYNIPMDWWVALPMAVFVVFLGFCLMGVGIGYVKLKGRE
jgi:hypothetical protein